MAATLFETIKSMMSQSSVGSRVIGSTHRGQATPFNRSEHGNGLGQGQGNLASRIGVLFIFAVACVMSLYYLGLGFVYVDVMTGSESKSKEMILLKQIKEGGGLPGNLLDKLNAQGNIDDFTNPDQFLHDDGIGIGGNLGKPEQPVAARPPLKEEPLPKPKPVLFVEQPARKPHAPIAPENQALSPATTPQKTKRPYKPPVTMPEPDPSSYFRIPQNTVTSTNLASRQTSIPAQEIHLYAIDVVPKAYDVCLIPRICAITDNTYLVPRFVEKYSRYLDRCIYSKKMTLEFADDPWDQSTWPEHLKSTGQPFVDQTEYGLLAAIEDLPSMPRSHFPHFITDVSPFISAADVVQGSQAGGRVLETCVSNPVAPPRPCANSSVNFDQKLFIESKNEVTVSAYAGPWVNGYIEMMAKIGVFTNTLWDFTKPRPATCYNSGIFAGGFTNQKFWTSLEDRFYLTNNIDLNARHVLRTQKDGTRKCYLTVTLLDRNNSRSFKTLSYMIDEIRKEAAEYDKHVTFTINHEYLEGRPLREQIDIMQMTDILVAAHGAGLTNILWMRQGSSVIEIGPFGYLGNFAFLAKKSKLEYRFLWSFSDEDRMRECIAPDQSYNETPDDFPEWTQFINIFNAGVRCPDSIPIPALNQVPGMARDCLRRQQIDPDSRVLAKVVMQHALNRCSAARDTM